MNYNQITNAVKRIICSAVRTSTNLTSDHNAGLDYLMITCAKFFDIGDEIEVGDCRYTITAIPSETQINISPPLRTFQPAGTTIKKLPYIDVWDRNPVVLPRYPAITIEIREQTQVPMALNLTFSHHYILDIGCWIESKSPEKVHSDWSKTTSRIETILNCNYNPIAGLMAETTLAEDVSETDTVMRLTQDFGESILNKEVFLSNCSSQKIVCFSNYLGNRIYETSCEVGQAFDKGSEILVPSLYGYNTTLSTYSGDAEQSNGDLLRVSRIVYEFDAVEIHRLRS